MLQIIIFPADGRTSKVLPKRYYKIQRITKCRTHFSQIFKRIAISTRMLYNPFSFSQRIVISYTIYFVPLVTNNNGWVVYRGHQCCLCMGIKELWIQCFVENLRAVYVSRFLFSRDAALKRHSSLNSTAWAYPQHKESSCRSQPCLQVWRAAGYI